MTWAYLLKRRTLTWAATDRSRQHPVVHDNGQ